MRALVFEGKIWGEYEKLRAKKPPYHIELRKTIQLTLRNPDTGSGNPKQLRHKFAGKWSRKITPKDRLIYNFDDKYLYLYGIQGHYNDK